MSTVIRDILSLLLHSDMMCVLLHLLGIFLVLALVVRSIVIRVTRKERTVVSSQFGSSTETAT